MEKWTRSVKAILIYSFLVGGIYPLIVTGFGQALFAKNANGSLVRYNDAVVGSELLGQKFEDPRYFWGRPSATNYQGLTSAASNLGPTSATLLENIDKQKKLFSPEEIEVGIPSDLLLSSASGFDPHISPKAAFFQMARVARIRALTKEQKDQLEDLIEERIEDPFLFFMGQARVNVLLLNRDVDNAFANLR